MWPTVAAMKFGQPVLRVEESEDDPLIRDEWPATVPAVQQLVDEGLDLAPGVTFLVGENGSGKSTLVEGIAMAYGMSPEGGSTHGHHATRDSESPLGQHLQISRGLGSSRWGFFLRAETMHGWYTYWDTIRRQDEPDFHAMSHGESFLAVLKSRFNGAEFYCLDEPEAALSFSSTLALVAILQEVVAAGGQVVCATHSPVLAAMPGARLVEVGEWGLREATWDELDLVQHWKRFLAVPEAYFRHLE